MGRIHSPRPRICYHLRHAGGFPRHPISGCFGRSPSGSRQVGWFTTCNYWLCLIFAALAGGLVPCCEYKIAHKYNNVNSLFGFFKIFFRPMVYSLLQSIYCVYFIRTQDIVVYGRAGPGAPLGDYGG